jgi:hypothetical protein
VGAALVLNAETVNDYVYEETPTNTQPQAKVVKKGKKDAQIKMNGKTIEIKEEKTVETKAKEDPKRTDLEIIFSDKQEGPEPLLVIDGKVATIEQVKALDKKEIDNISVVKNEETLKVYAKHFEADTSNGIIFINTKEHVKNGKKEVVEVVVKSK